MASLTAALLLLGTIATPSLAGIEGPGEEGDPTVPAAEVDHLAADVAGDEIVEATEEEPDVADEPEPEAPALSAAAMEAAPTETPLEVANGGGQHCPHDGPGAPPGAVNAASGELTIDGVTIRWSGDPGVVVITNPTDLDATVVWCAKGGNDFAGDGSQVIGEMRTSVAAGEEATEGPFGTEISYLVVYRVEFDQPDEPDTVTIELMKAWFDLDGQRVEAPDVAWGIELSAGPPDAVEILATLPGDDNVAQVALLEYPDGSPAPARYGIAETPAPAGWQAVDCDDVDVGELTWLNQGTSAMLVASGADSGAFGAMESGIHLVCNQQVEEPDEPDTVTIELMKAWFDVDGQPLAADPDVDWSLTMTVSEDGVTDTVVAELPGDDAAAEFAAGDRYGVQEQLIPDGWEPVACDTVDFDAMELPADVVAQNTSLVSVALGAPDGSFAATDSGVHLVCNQEVVEVLPIDVEKPEVEEPEPAAEKPETEPAEEAVEVEVLASELPRTGAGLALLASLAAGLMFVGGVGLAAGGRKGGRRR